MRETPLSIPATALPEPAACKSARKRAGGRPLLAPPVRGILPGLPLPPPSKRPAIAASPRELISELSDTEARRSSALTRERCVSRVTRAGDGGRSEGFAPDGRKSAKCSPLTEPRRLRARAKSKIARDRPDIAARPAVPAAGSTPARLRLPGACGLDPAPHRKYDIANMQLCHSLMDAATEPCRGGYRRLRKKDNLPRRVGVISGRRADRSVAVGGLQPAVNDVAASHVATNHESFRHESFGAKAPRRHDGVTVTIDRPPRSSNRSALIRDVVFTAAPHACGVLEMDCTGLVWCPPRLAPGRRAKREN